MSNFLGWPLTNGNQAVVTQVTAAFPPQTTVVGQVGQGHDQMMAHGFARREDPKARVARRLTALASKMERAVETLSDAAAAEARIKTKLAHADENFGVATAGKDSEDGNGNGNGMGKGKGKGMDKDTRKGV